MVSLKEALMYCKRSGVVVEVEFLNGSKIIFRTVDFVFSDAVKFRSDKVSTVVPFSAIKQINYLEGGLK